MVEIGSHGTLIIVAAEVWDSNTSERLLPLMYSRPAFRVFSESAPPLQCTSSTVSFSARSLRNLFDRSPATVRSQLCHATVTGTFKSSSRTRNRYLSPSSCPSSGWRMAMSSSRSVGIIESAESSASPLPVEDAGGTGPDSSREDVIVQYIVIRKDLVEGLNWPLGSVISQGCHAAVAAVWLHRDDPVTRQYCGPDSLNSMHKVTLEVKGETQLRNLAQKLESGGIIHKLWIEQPENYATCLATKPYPKSEVSSYFKKLKLCK